MEHEKLRSQIVSHRVLNYLNATYQGKFAFLNILSQLGDTRFDSEDIKATKEVLEKVDVWLDQLWNGTTIFDERRGANQGEDAEQALDYLRSLKDELTQLASELKLALGNDKLHEDHAQATLLIASFGRDSYSRDNYVRGFVEFGRVYSDSELIALWEPQIEEVAEKIKLANDFLKLIKEPEKLDAGFSEHIGYFCRVLPGSFRSHVHDINQLLCSYRGTFSYERADFAGPEANIWERHEVSPVEAGYWRAHDFGVDEAVEWRKAGIVDPNEAGEWKTAGFTSDLAIAWIEVQFSPLLAIQWHAARFAPDEAGILVSKGFYYPDQVPEEKVEQILKEGFEEMEKLKKQGKSLDSSESEVENSKSEDSEAKGNESESSEEGQEEKDSSSTDSNATLENTDPENTGSQ